MEEKSKEPGPLLDQPYGGSWSRGVVGLGWVALLLFLATLPETWKPNVRLDLLIVQGVLAALWFLLLAFVQFARERLFLDSSRRRLVRRLEWWGKILREVIVPWDEIESFRLEKLFVHGRRPLFAQRNDGNEEWLANVPIEEAEDLCRRLHQEVVGSRVEAVSRSREVF